MPLHLLRVRLYLNLVSVDNNYEEQVPTVCQHLYQDFYAQLHVTESLRTFIPSREQWAQRRAPPFSPVCLSNPFEEAHGHVELARGVIRPCNSTCNAQCQSTLTVSIGQRRVLLEKFVRFGVQLRSAPRSAPYDIDIPEITHLEHNPEVINFSFVGEPRKIRAVHFKIL